MKIYKIKVNGKTYRVELEAVEEVVSDKVVEEKKVVNEVKSVAASGEGTPVLAPIQGQVIDIKVSCGKQVKKGDVLLVIEAMKLENEVLSPVDGTIGEIIVTKGKNVANKELLLTIK